MGILNVTPDSFSDGGRFLDVDAAVAHGRQMRAEGADWIDVGGESTRPGAQPVSLDEETSRVLPVVEALAPDGPVSIDTTKPELARAAVQSGASLVNDVSASLHQVCAELAVAWVAMHRQGDSRTMQDQPRYHDVVAEVAAFLAAAAARGGECGVPEVWIDPGIGFGKTTEHNLALLAAIPQLCALGRPVVIGASRKRFIGELHGLADDGPFAPVDDRLEGSLAVATWAASQGAAMVRVHDVAETVQAMAVVAA